MRVLIVDDSAFMRTALTNVFRADEGWDVRTARDGRDALAAIADFEPDVVTLDVNMPGMDGLTCLSHIMTECPRPVVMVSSLTSQGATSTLEALAMGAVDFVTKPSGTVSLDVKTVGSEIVAKVRAAGMSKRRAKPARRERPASGTKMRVGGSSSPAPPDGVVLIGCSTGGPRALEDVIGELPGDFPLPIVVAQHMPGGFTGALAQRLDEVCALTVVEVTGVVPLRPGMVAIAKGDADVVLSRRGANLCAVSVPMDAKYAWHPSVDRMVASALDVARADQIVGVLLTGMGNDGARTMAEVKKGGGYTVAESEESSVVFGMPGSLVQLRGAAMVLSSDQIGLHLARLYGTRRTSYGSR